MEDFVKEIQIRWSDIDPNFHLRHSVYYDWGALSRIEFLYTYGLTTELMHQLHFGPILFREEAIFKKEIRLDDLITLDVVMVKSTEDFARWSLRHHFTKEDGSLAAVLNIDGAWMDLVKRKLAIPNQFIQQIFAMFPKAEEYELIVKKEK